MVGIGFGGGGILHHNYEKEPRKSIRNHLSVYIRFLWVEGVVFRVYSIVFGWFWGVSFWPSFCAMTVQERATAFLKDSTVLPSIFIIRALAVATPPA